MCGWIPAFRLTAQQLAAAEAEANAAVRADTRVRCYVPDAATLAATEYRSKKELEGPVRLVEAGGGPLRLLRHPPGPHRRGGAHQDHLRPALQGGHAAGRGLRPARL